MLERLLGKLTRALIKRRWLVLLLWLLPLPAFVYGYMAVNRKLLTVVMTSPDAQSTFVDHFEAYKFDKQSQFLALMTFHDDRRQFDDDAYMNSKRKVHASVKKVKCIKAITYYEMLPFRSLFVSKDGHTQVTLIEMDVGLNDYHAAARCVNRIRRAIRQVRPQMPIHNLEVLVTGPPAVDVDIGRLIRKDSRRAELIVALCSLLLLVWMFRSASAAFLPIITASLAVTGSLFVSFLVALRVELSMYVGVVTSMTGLGLGLDYALLYVSRFREERERGMEPAEAIAKAAQTSGVAILGSGIIVMMGFAVLFIPPLRFPQSVALAGMLTVAFTLSATLTLLPVLLSFWYPTMHWPRWRWFRASHEAVDRFWERWSAGVLKRPLLLVLVGVVVVSTAGPNLLRLRLKNPRHEAIPMKLESRRGMERLVQILGASEIYRITVVLQITDQGTWVDKKRQKWLLQVMNQIRSWPEVYKVRGPDMMTRLLPFAKFGTGVAERYVSRTKRLVSLDIYGKDGTDTGLNKLVAKLRRECPRFFANDPAVKTYVGGKQATFYETKRGIEHALPLIFPILGLCAFLFMAFFFRSLVVPAKALLLNTLSLFTTFGLLVLVIQDGHGLWLLGYSGPPPGALSVATPIILFGVVFGVSMDYEVFLMSRIREAWRERSAGANTPKELEQAHRDAIYEGLSKTGGIITNAALIMVITFAAFISGTVLPMKEMGFALALAVALDATLVRMILVPALLRLLGRRTWYWPHRGHR